MRSLFSADQDPSELTAAVTAHFSSSSREGTIQLSASQYDYALVMLLLPMVSMLTAVTSWQTKQCRQSINRGLAAPAIVSSTTELDSPEAHSSHNSDDKDHDNNITDNDSDNNGG
jgi:hypothetical protein